jgi:hypothetical protein
MSFLTSLRLRREARQVRKRQRAYDRLHGRGAVSVPPRRQSRSSADGLGELIGDVLLALPRGIMWLVSKILD